MVFKVKYYEETEEKWNVITHAIGFFLSLIVFPVLMYKAIVSKDLATVLSYAIYGISMILLYAASTLYHSAINRKVRYYLNILDHAAVYVLIAGSYAPISLLVLEGRLGWLVFGISWAIAVFGIIYKVYFIGKYKLLSVGSYVTMGWLLLFFLEPLMFNLPVWGQRWLLLGGIFYSIGAYFFIANKIKYNHAIFHILVLLGSLCHFITVYYHIT